MKIEYGLFIFGVVLTIVGLVADFMNAPTYYFHLVTAVACDLMALISFGLVFSLKRGWLIAAAIPGLIALYTMTDAFLRLACGTSIFHFII